MYLERKEPENVDLYSSSNLTTNQIIEKINDLLNNCTETVNTIVNADFDKLSDEEYYKMISKIYYINVWYEDYLKVLSKKYGKKYDTFITFPVDSFHKVWKSEGHGEKVDTYMQTVYDEYTAAVPFGHECTTKDSITIQDVEEYIKDDSILLIDRKEVETYDGEECDKNYKQFPIFRHSKDDLNESLNFFKNNISLFVELFRKDYPKARVLEDLKDYLYDFSSDLNDSIAAIGEVDYDMSRKAEACRIWYYSSKEGLAFQKMLKDMKI